ncbi:MAG: ferredoxin [Nanoarchaeota archaeon]
MKIIYEPKKCIGCGSCVTSCPSLFKMGKDNKAIMLKAKKVKDNFELEIKSETQEIKDAVDMCPTQCFKIEK